MSLIWSIVVGVIAGIFVGETFVRLRKDREKL